MTRYRPSVGDPVSTPGPRHSNGAQFGHRLAGVDQNPVSFAFVAAST